MRTGSIILTGGRSKRMGRPKESLRIAGGTLLGRTVETLLGCTAPVVVVARVGQELPVLPAAARTITDEVPDAGPLAALVAGLRFLRREDLLGDQDAVFATGCDAPFLPAAVVSWLVDRLGDAPLVMPEALGHLQPLCALAKEHGIHVVLGCMERAADRGGHSLYCALVQIGTDGALLPVHRKLVPTHEERLVWAPGDGHGLRCHRLSPFTVGALLCWENWMTLPRAALHADGEDLHVALWPGNVRNTEELTRFLAREGRSYVLSVSGLLRHQDLPESLPHGARLRAALPAQPANGGSCIAGPDGQWVVPPIVGEERLCIQKLDHAFVRRERQNFDPAGHYSRPDVLRLELDRARQGTLRVRM